HYIDEERVNRDSFGLPILDDWDLQQPFVADNPNGSVAPRFEPLAAGKYVIGLTVTDVGGATSSEATTAVYVVPAFDASIRPRIALSVDPDGTTVRIDARTSSGGGGQTVQWIADAQNPGALGLTPSTDGRQVTFAKPAAGVYWVHVQIGNSY